jgi:hypothetical protein
MNRSFTQKIILVIVLVTLMGAGAMSSASDAPPSSVQSAASNNIAYVMGSANDNSGLKQSSPHALCHEERQSSAALAGLANITARNMYED